MLAADAGVDGHRVESRRFVFHSDPWINLHHFLFQWARNAEPRLSGDRRRPVKVVELDQLEDFAEQDRRAWERAVGHYRDHLVERDLLFGRDLVALRGRLGGRACPGARAEDAEPALRAVLDEAMAVHRLRWWPAHRAANETWIQDQKELLSEEERESARFIADAMAERRRSREQYQIVREHWTPFLEGKIDRDVALDRIVVELVR